MLLEAAPQVHPLIRLIADLPVSEFVRSSVWAYPALETVHLFGLGLLFGPIVIFDLRVLGFLRASGVAALAALLLPWVWLGFVLNLASGFLLFGSDANEFSVNPAFLAKMALIVFAGLNAMIFQWRASTVRGATDGAERLGLRLQALLSIVLWSSVIVAGRMIAYVA